MASAGRQALLVLLCTLAACAGRLVLLALLCALAAACASREILIPKSAAAPPGIDFSGQWQLRADMDAEERRVDRAIRKTDGVKGGTIIRRAEMERHGNRPPVYAGPSSHGGLVHVFLQLGRNLKITQTKSAIFVSFDRAVVEEFRFGENREVHVGPVEADRVSGWEGNTYVVETLDENEMKLIERFAFGDNRNALRRTITLRGRNMESETVVQVFDRVD